MSVDAVVKSTLVCTLHGSVLVTNIAVSFPIIRIPEVSLDSFGNISVDNIS